MSSTSTMERKAGVPASLLADHEPPASSAVNFRNGVARKLSLLSGLAVLLLLSLLAWNLVKLSWPSLQKFGLRFFVTGTWDPVEENFGILPFLYGTMVTSGIALLIATPFGVGTALFLTELAPARLKGPVGFVVDMLAAIPSVVYGLWGIFVLAPAMQAYVGPFLIKVLGFLPWFQGPCFGVSLLTAGMVLSIMVVPYITAISREVLSTVPSELKAASLALGATQWETIWKVVLPYSRVGIGGGVVLALGRALGETMAVTMVVGNQTLINWSVLKPGYSMASVIANEFTEATTPLYLAALAEVGLALFLVTILINIAARFLLWKMRHATGH